jgi:S-DNA-T family DNA segregation ATPase FtsK/SpoIIIE
MTFVLIDYKGGAAFKDCADLPHTVGMVTDLDHHLTRRALRSLDAEVARRERLLSSVGAKDIDGYLRPDTDSAEPLPRLVIVVDEFATLVDELPDFVTGLVGIAMRGRSLGVHLILATQRPSGVVSPVIRANTSLRLALRMTDDSESRDVLDVADAARISAARPGRGFARTATGAPVEFQAARVGGRGRGSRIRPDRPTVRLSPWSIAGDTSGTPADPIDDSDTDLRTTVAAIRSAVDPDTDPPRRPWLPPLPTVVTLADLGACSGDVLPYGLADHPAEQRQATHAIDLARGGSVLVAGGPRSGRSTTLRTIAGAAASRFGPEDLHLYVLDCAGGALSAAADLPHCGAVCGRLDVDRGDRMLARLAAEVDRRQSLLGARGFASVTEQRAAVPEADRLAWLLLLVDGWEGFQAAYDEVDGGRPVETLLRLAREGGAAGLRVVVTGGRPALTGRISAALPTKVVLRCADPLDYGLAGLSPRAVPDAMPDGRIVAVDGAVEAQVALLGPDPSGPAQAAALRDIATRPVIGVPTRPRAFCVRALPTSVDPADIAGPAAPGPLWALVGVGGDDADAVGVDLARDGPGFLVAGPARSGRSTALRTMATSLLAQGTPIAIVAARRSPMRALAGTPGVRGVFGPGDAGPLAEAIEAGPVVTVVDDIALLTDTAAGDVVTDVLKSDDGMRAVIASGRNDEVAMLFRGPAVTVRAGRCGLLLSPSPTDGDLLGVRLPRGVGPAPPGRGVLVVGGRVSAIQVAADGALPP